MSTPLEEVTKLLENLRIEQDALVVKSGGTPTSEQTQKLQELEDDIALVLEQITEVNEAMGKARRATQATPSVDQLPTAASSDITMAQARAWLFRVIDHGELTDAETNALIQLKFPSLSATDEEFFQLLGVATFCLQEQQPEGAAPDLNYYASKARIKENLKQQFLVKKKLYEERIRYYKELLSKESGADHRNSLQERLTYLGQWISLYQDKIDALATELAQCPKELGTSSSELPLRKTSTVDREREAEILLEALHRGEFFDSLEERLSSMSKFTAVSTSRAIAGSVLTKYYKILEYVQESSITFLNNTKREARALHGLLTQDIEKLTTRNKEWEKHCNIWSRQLHYYPLRERPIYLGHISRTQENIALFETIIQQKRLQLDKVQQLLANEEHILGSMRERRPNEPMTLAKVTELSLQVAMGNLLTDAQIKSLIDLKLLPDTPEADISSIIELCRWCMCKSEPEILSSESEIINDRRLALLSERRLQQNVAFMKIYQQKIYQYSRPRSEAERVSFTQKQHYYKDLIEILNQDNQYLGKTAKEIAQRLYELISQNYQIGKISAMVRDQLYQVLSGDDGTSFVDRYDRIISTLFAIQLKGAAALVDVLVVNLLSELEQYKPRGFKQTFNLAFIAAIPRIDPRQVPLDILSKCYHATQSWYESLTESQPKFSIDAMYRDSYKDFLLTIKRLLSFLCYAINNDCEQIRDAIEQLNHIIDKTIPSLADAAPHQKTSILLQRVNILETTISAKRAQATQAQALITAASMQLQEFGETRLFYTFRRSNKAAEQLRQQLDKSVATRLSQQLSASQSAVATLDQPKAT